MGADAGGGIGGGLRDGMDDCYVIGRMGVRWAFGWRV